MLCYVMPSQWDSRNLTSDPVHSQQSLTQIAVINRRAYNSLTSSPAIAERPRDARSVFRKGVGHFECEFQTEGGVVRRPLTYHMSVVGGRRLMSSQRGIDYNRETYS